jgi:hypothetical protein
MLTLKTIGLYWVKLDETHLTSRNKTTNKHKYYGTSNRHYL